MSTVNIKIHNNSSKDTLKISTVSYPKHLPQVGVSEAEGDVRDMEALGLGLARSPLLIAPTSCPSPRWYGRAQRLRVRGHGCQSILLVAGRQVTRETRVGSKWGVRWVGRLRGGGVGGGVRRKEGTTTERWETKDGRIKEHECGGGKN